MRAPTEKSDSFLPSEIHRASCHRATVRSTSTVALFQPAFGAPGKGLVESRATRPPLHAHPDDVVADAAPFGAGRVYNDEAELRAVDGSRHGEVFLVIHVPSNPEADGRLS